MLELAFTDPLADSHSAAPDALGQSPTAGSTANKGSASTIPTIVMVLRFLCRLNGSFQGVSADQGPIVIRLELPHTCPWLAMKPNWPFGWKLPFDRPATTLDRANLVGQRARDNFGLNCSAPHR